MVAKFPSRHNFTVALWVHAVGLAVKLGPLVVWYSIEPHACGWHTSFARDHDKPVKSHVHVFERVVW